MVFIDFTESIPFPLSGRSSVSAALFTRSTHSYDFALGGLPWLSKIDDEHPYTRMLAPIRKEQFDNQQIPGEQSLTGWWLRSQSTFVGGQGLLYQDPSNDNAYAFRYGSGYGVNPWVNGKVTLLKSTSQQISAASGDVFVRGFVDSATDYYWHANAATLSRRTASATTAVTWGGAASILTLTSSGNKYYVASTEGVYRGTNAGAGTQLWNNDISYTRTNIEYVKQRLMAAFDNKIYELGADPGAPPVNLSTLTAKYTHPNANYVWTGFADGTGAILAGGHDGMQGHVYKFTLDTSGSVPTLTGGILAASLPLGETLLSIYTYLGKFVGLGTSRGFRIGIIDANGDLEYGPLLFEISGGVKCITGYDRFMWVGATDSVNGKAGLYRVDLGQVLQDQGATPTIRFAYATDLSTGTTGTVTSVTTFGDNDQRVIGVAAKGSYLESATELESTGVLETGRIRFNTLESKLFKFMSIKTPDPMAGGSLSVASVDQTGNAINLITYTTTAPGDNDVSITAPEGPQNFLSLRFTLSRSGSDATKGPEVNGWQLKAVPGVIRQRMIEITFLCFDYEVDKSGQKIGYAGRTSDRLRAMEMLAQTGDALQSQDLNLNTTDLVFVEDMQFRQLSSPGKGFPVSGYGGLLSVRLRTMNDNVEV